MTNVVDGFHIKCANEEVHNAASYFCLECKVTAKEFN